MDPITSALNLANSFIQLVMKIYDDTPEDVRKQNAQNWSNFIASAEKFITTGKLGN